MHVQRHEVSVTTNGSGDATEHSVSINGILDRIIYQKTDFADGVDFAITLDETGETLWTEENVNASAVRAPRQPVHGTDGVAALYATGGKPVNDLISIMGKVKIVISNGGDTKSGTFQIVTF